MAFNADDWIIGKKHFVLKNRQFGNPSSQWTVIAEPYERRYKGRGGKKWNWAIRPAPIS